MTGLVHDAFVYSEDTEYVSSMAPFLREGIERGEAVAAVTVPANAARLRGALGRAGDDVQVVDARTWYAHPSRTVAQYSELFRDMLGDGATRLRVVGEVQFGATSDEHDDWACYESALNHVFADLPAWIVCPYDTRSLPASVVERAALTHPHVTDGSGRVASTRYDAPAHFVGRMQSLGAVPSRAPDVDLVLDDGLPAMRRSIVDAACARGRESGLVEPFVLAVNEVATNAIVHGGGDGRVRLWVDDRELLCVVSDAGRGLDDALAGFTPPPRGRVGGRGLWIARQLCDSVRVSRASGGGLAVALRTSAR